MGLFNRSSNNNSGGSFGNRPSGRRVTPVDLPAATKENTRDEISELSAVAQKAENSGDRILAEAAHNQLNNALDRLRRL
ncbi:hypothetical protein [Kitasatospora sp. NPDC008115]|uniref:hypothetical protein n=1 Tax=Kitasatospora sp. NPDC008115 TaxID=3364022 RepID=UPI0036EA8CD8